MPVGQQQHHKIANAGGVCLALINWHRIQRRPVCSIMSRGQVVRKLAGKSSTSEVAVALNELPLNRLRPFRLVAIIPTEKSLTEWRWDLDRLTTRKHAWKSRHWFSSGFDEPRAKRERDRVCKAARNQNLEDGSIGCGAWIARTCRSAGRSRSVCTAQTRPRSATRRSLFLGSARRCVISRDHAVPKGEWRLKRFRSRADCKLP